MDGTKELRNEINSNFQVAKLQNIITSKLSASPYLNDLWIPEVIVLVL